MHRASDTLEADVKDDVQLIDEALDGESAAFGQLVCKYQDRLYNTIVHVVGCRDEAEDVVQDAFIQAFVKLASFRRDSAFYTWLYRIAFNTAISHRRRRRTEMSVERGREVLGVEPLDEGDAPDDPLLREERVGQVRQALSALSEEHRAILVLREMEGCCYETIADILDLPIGTVRSRLHRARLQLREELKEALQGNSAP
jgi:RNA polymerase sigma-70 factor (ECF subfamily)